MGAGVVSGRELGPGVQAAGQGMLDIWQFFLARLVQHEIGYRLRQAEGARVADADAQAPEIGCAEPGLDVLQAVVPAVAAALLEANIARL